MSTAMAEPQADSLQDNASRYLDHPDFDVQSPWPRRLLHVPSMTSWPWRPGNFYGDHEAPKYNALSYTWGRWSLDDSALKSIESIEITGVSWPIPRIHPDHFTVDEFMNVIRLSSINAGKVEGPGEQATKSPCDFLWLDVACIDQKHSATYMSEIGRQAIIFENVSQVFIWLNRYDHTKLSPLCINLRAVADRLRFDSSIDAPFQNHLFSVSVGIPLKPEDNPNWPFQALEDFTSLIADPWFSSLWTLQEAFLSSMAQILSRDGQTITYKPGPNDWGITLSDSTFTLWDLEDIVQFLMQYCSRRTMAETQGTVAPSKPELSRRLYESGIGHLFLHGPIALLPVARFRVTTRPEDCVYGIMQIFNFKLGNARNGSAPSSPYTLPELEDELGEALIQAYPLQSQCFIFTEPPPVGKGWHISTICAIPRLDSLLPNRASDSRSARFNQNLPWNLITKRLRGILWGYLSGLACPLHTLAKAWAHPYREIIALDRDPCFLDSPEFGVLNIPFGERQHALTLWLLKSFHPEELRMFLLAFKDGGMGVSGPFCIGLIIHERNHLGLRYWHRLGICVWTVGDFSSEEFHINPYRDMLVGGGKEWQKIEGLFG
jgi:hypothetical protein